MSKQIAPLGQRARVDRDQRNEIGRGITLFVLLVVIAGMLQRANNPPSAHPPVGMGIVALGSASDDSIMQTNTSWYYRYGFTGSASVRAQRVYLVPLDYDERALARTLTDHPGSWWMVGNEPNDPHQDNLSPGAYAAFYHRFSKLAQRVDPTCRIMPAGIANADWGWAHDFRESYRHQYGYYPRVDAWNVHNYILEPEHDPWELGEFQRRLLVFRDWMERVGEGAKPLVLSEFGVLFHSLPGGMAVTSEHIISFMQDSVRWMAANGVVNGWAWFATYGGGQFNGELTDAQGTLTPYGRAYRDLAQELAPQEPYQ